ncbi:MAG: hypothetical protein BWX86_00967 [Verrucomicrobia bacterium ADurb.Bin122]|nr:MAG: hypothetical protein BWX86_00967 [Verrucomicrobia bacterium ADurb.Bin122]
MRQRHPLGLPRTAAGEKQRDLLAVAHLGQAEQGRQPLIGQQPDGHQPAYDRRLATCGRNQRRHVPSVRRPWEVREFRLEDLRRDHRANLADAQTRLLRRAAHSEIQIHRNLARTGDGQIGDRGPRPRRQYDAHATVRNRFPDVSRQRRRHRQQLSCPHLAAIARAVDDLHPPWPFRQCTDGLARQVTAQQWAPFKRLLDQIEQRLPHIRCIQFFRRNRLAKGNKHRGRHQPGRLPKVFFSRKGKDRAPKTIVAHRQHRHARTMGQPVVARPQVHQLPRPRNSALGEHTHHLAGLQRRQYPARARKCTTRPQRDCPRQSKYPPGKPVRPPVIVVADKTNRTRAGQLKDHPVDVRHMVCHQKHAPTLRQVLEARRADIVQQAGDP